MDKLAEWSKDFKTVKSVAQYLLFPGTISFGRVFLYAYLSGDNGFSLDKDGFLEACTRYGLDSPVPCFSKRLAMYGNTEDVAKYLKDIVDKTCPQSSTDLAIFGQVDNPKPLRPKALGIKALQEKIHIEGPKPLLDMNETQVAQGQNKVSGAVNIRLLSMDHHKDGFSPAEAFVHRSVKLNVRELSKTDPPEL